MAGLLSQRFADKLPLVTASTRHRLQVRTRRLL
jgi:hypothetical protein